MSNKIGVLISGLLLVCISTSAVAAKPTEAMIYHCGCVANNEFSEEASADLRWSLLVVHAKSKGHQNHALGDTETCFFEDDIAQQEVELARGFDDCEVDDLLEGVATCDTEGATQTPVAGESCEVSESLCPCAQNPEWDTYLESGNWNECEFGGPQGAFTYLFRLQDSATGALAFSGLLNSGEYGCMTNPPQAGFFGITAEEAASCEAELQAAADVVGTDCTIF